MKRFFIAGAVLVIGGSGTLIMAQSPNSDTQVASTAPAGNKAVPVGSKTAKSDKSDYTSSETYQQILAKQWKTHCDSCGHLDVYDEDVDHNNKFDETFAFKKNKDDREFIRQIRTNYITNMLSGNITGPFHSAPGQCSCNHIHDALTQAIVDEARREAARRAAAAAAAAKAKYDASPEGIAEKDRLARAEDARKIADSNDRRAAAEKESAAATRDLANEVRKSNR